MRQIWPQKMKKLCLVLLPVVCMLLVLGLYGRLPKSDDVVLEGSVEIATSICYAQVGGVVQDVPVQVGEQVKGGDVLAQLDDRDLQNQIQQLEAVRTMKLATVKQLQQSADNSGVQAARAAAQSQVAVYQERLEAAKRTQLQAQKDYEENRLLFEAGAISQKELAQWQIAAESAETAVAVAEAELQAANHTVQTFVTATSQEGALEAACADVRLTELQIENLQQKQEQYCVTALHDGLVINRTAEQGAIVTAGQNLFELSKADAKYFVFYLPQAYSRELAFGQEIPLYRINEKTTLGTAQICYIDWKAVYTPEDFATSANKNKKSIKVKALIDSDEAIGVGETLVTRFQKQEQSE